jgi:hypothetical protein
MLKNSTSVDIYLEALRLIEEDICKSVHISGYYKRRISSAAPAAIYVRKLHPEGTQGVAIEVSPAVVKPLKLSHTTKGFSVSTELTERAEGKKVCRVAISLGEAAFKELFAELVGHLLDHISNASSEKDAMLRLQSQLLLWRKFLDRGADEGLSENEQTGLYGELAFMKLCLKAGIPAIDILNAWTGPNGANQDFTFGSDAIEVKSSSANDANRTRISNIRQLDDTGLEGLFLYHHAFDRRQSSGQTLPQLVQILITLIKEQDAALTVFFDELLMSAGYLHAHQVLYSDVGYTLRYENAYKVDASFPRLLEANLPPGLSEVKFMVDLATAVSSRINREEIFKALGYSEI